MTYCEKVMHPETIKSRRCIGCGINLDDEKITKGKWVQVIERKKTFLFFSKKIKKKIYVMDATQAVQRILVRCPSLNPWRIGNEFDGEKL